MLVWSTPSFKEHTQGGMPDIAASLKYLRNIAQKNYLAIEKKINNNNTKKNLSSGLSLFQPDNAYCLHTSK